jgi:hypothetical protein
MASLPVRDADHRARDETVADAIEIVLTERRLKE